MPPQIIYQVMGGDTCIEIATKYRMTVDELIQQNGLNADCTLQIGQVLTLTFAQPTPEVSPTPIIAQTPTPRVGYNAPLLTPPRDGEQISDTQAVVTLQWLSTGILREDEWYVVQVQLLARSQYPCSRPRPRRSSLRVTFSVTRPSGHSHGGCR